MSFMKEIRVASMAFEAYFIISAEGISVKSSKRPFSIKGLYNRSIIVRARPLSTPTTTRSGSMKSLMAAPSLRNSGLEATSNSTFIPRWSSSLRMAARTSSPVPTGTVLLVTKSVYPPI